jgi:hypothetical protein
MAVQIDLGKLKIKYQGVYDVATAYEVDDAVQYVDGGVTSTYLCIAASTGNNPSTGGNEHASWKYMAKGTSSVGMSWNAAQTADFTAAGANGYEVDTTSGAIEVTLPAAPSAGDEIRINDYAKTFHTNHCTLAANGNKIEGNTDNWNLWQRGTNVFLVYADGIKGWKIMQYSDDSSADKFKSGSQGQGSKKYMIATSDAEEVYMDGDYMVHKFLSSGTWTVHSLGSDSTFGDKIEYLCVGGGGSGGQHHGGGGGAGGYRANNAYDHVVTAQAYTITVGAGGTEHSGNNRGNKGSDSTFDGMNSEGGGTGAGGSHTGQDGGSGGGSAHSAGHGHATGNGTGHRGGSHSNHQGGGGGGAGREGADHYGSHQSGHGGRGAQNDISGIPKWYAAGGGASGHNHTNAAAGGGGDSIGGDSPGGWGMNGTGSGGGGNDGSSGGHRHSGQGGDGIIIIRYKAKD